MFSVTGDGSLSDRIWTLRLAHHLLVDVSHLDATVEERRSRVLSSAVTRSIRMAKGCPGLVLNTTKYDRRRKCRAGTRKE